MYTDNKKNGRLAAVLLIAVLFVCVALPVGAQDAALPNFTIADDTLSVEADQAPAVDSAAFAYQPEWYVAPVIPAPNVLRNAPLWQLTAPRIRY